MGLATSVGLGAELGVIVVAFGAVTRGGVEGVLGEVVGAITSVAVCAGNGVTPPTNAFASPLADSKWGRNARLLYQLTPIHTPPIKTAAITP